MRMASVADVKARLSTYLKETQEGPVIVTRNGKAVAVLVAVTDEDELERLVLAYSPKFQALLDKSRRRFTRPGGFRTQNSARGRSRRPKRRRHWQTTATPNQALTRAAPARSGVRVRFRRHPASDRRRLVALPASVP